MDRHEDTEHQVHGHSRLGAGDDEPLDTTASLHMPDQPLHQPGDPVVMARRLSRVGIAAFLASTRAARESLGADPTPSRSEDVGIGAMALLRETSLQAGRLAGKAVNDVAVRVNPLVKRAEGLPGVGPMVAAGRVGVGSTLSTLADTGRAERRLADAEGTMVVERTVAAVAGSDLLPDAAAATVATLPKALDTVLPVVIERIAAEPDLLVPLVTGVLNQLATDPKVVAPLVDSVMGELASDPDQLLTLVERVLDPVVAAAIPVALQQLTDNPEAIRALIWDQSGGLADELANSFRARLVSADDAINRITDRLFGRTRRARKAAAAGGATA